MALASIMASDSPDWHKHGLLGREPHMPPGSCTYKWVQQWKPWEAHRTREPAHEAAYPPRGVVEGVAKATLGQLFGHYSFAQCLLMLGSRRMLVEVFMEEADRQWQSQQELVAAPMRQSAKEWREDLQRQIGILRRDMQNASYWDAPGIQMQIREFEEQLAVATRVSAPGRDTAPRGIVARVACHLLGGLVIPDICAAPDCQRNQELAICSLCSHMVCRRHLPVLTQSLRNNSS